jgi:hypothetical protein
MTIRVYTVDRAGTVSAPRATVAVPYGQKNDQPPFQLEPLPCACPIHRATGPTR